MSKSRNRKRNQMLRQRKKDKEIAKQNNELPGQSKMGKRLKNLLGADVSFRNNNISAEKKISNVVLQMIQPLLDEAQSFKDEKNIVGLGVMAWNLGVLKMYEGEKKMLESLKDFRMLLSKDILELMMKYVEIKCNNFGEYDQII